MNYYTAKINVRSAATTAYTSTSAQSSSTPSITTPWDTPTKDKGIASRLAELNGRTSFFDMKDPKVTAAGKNVDDKNLFGMYEALRRLRVVAEYAAADATPSGILGQLNTQFQGGLTEVSNFLKNTAFDKATVLFGNKAASTTSQAGAGTVDYNYVGRSVVTGTADTPLTGLTGTEKFTITLKKSLNTDNITVDLSQISGPITMQKIIDLANNQIAAITDVDTNGNTVERYRTRLTTQDIGGGAMSLKVRGFAGESVSLSAASTSPTLTIAGTVQHTGTSTLSEGFLYSLGDLANSSPTAISRTQITATAPGATAIAAADAKANASNTNYVAPELQKASAEAHATATDASGNTFVVGTAQGDMGGQFYQASTQDVYLSKYDSAGKLIWSRLLGSSSDSNAYSVATDSQGNVVVAGQTNDNLTTTSVIDSTDSFVTKYSSTGQELFTRQVQASAPDAALGVTIDSSDNIYVGGHVNGVIDANATNAGGYDAYIQKINGTDGTVAYTHQFGTSGTDKAGPMAIANDGSLLVVSNENGNAVLHKFDATNPNTELYSVNLGALGNGDVTGIAVDASGGVFVSGYTDNGSFGVGTTATAHHGGTDGFVSKITDNGSSATSDYTSFVGGTGNDEVYSLTTDNGSVYAVGSTDAGLNGQTLSTTKDGFAVKLDGASGSQTWTQEFSGGQGLSTASSVSVNSQGQSVLSTLGLPTGTVAADQDRTIVSQSSVRAGDYFYISVNGGAKLKVTVNADDTIKTLASRINTMSFLYMSARASYSSATGDTLTIQAQRGAKINIIPGDGSRDALKGLGMDANMIVDDSTSTSSSSSSSTTSSGVPSLADIANKKNNSSSDTPPETVFGLGLSNTLHLTDKKSAKYALAQIDSALGAIRDMYRKLNPDPVIEALKKQKAAGPAPAYLQAQLANYQAGLARVTAVAQSAAQGTTSSSGGLLL